MVIDSSVLIAILLAEPEKELFLKRLLDAPHRFISAGSYYETLLVLTRKGRKDLLPVCKELLHEFKCDVIPFYPYDAEDAARYYGIYGKTFHPAALNFGDCFAYALAVSLGEPLLFKGTDFHKTDVMVA